MSNVSLALMLLTLTPSEAVLEEARARLFGMNGRALRLQARGELRRTGQPVVQITFDVEPCRGPVTYSSKQGAGIHLFWAVVGALCHPSPAFQVAENRDSTVVLEAAGEGTLRLEIDKRSGLPRRVRADHWRSTHVPLVLPPCEVGSITADFADYRDANGARLPHAITVRSACGTDRWVFEHLDVFTP